MMGRYLAILVAVITLGAATQLPAAERLSGQYIWPLKDKTTLSSGFCDYRRNHYHGGIDLSTGGSVGIPVRAADSGYVLRVSTSYWGYGKAIYLKMTDGRIAVYGHLSEFSDEIQAFVESNQYAARRYHQNLWPAPNQLKVGRGEVIAKSGQTGAGPPHLHFEIRTAENRPLNPLVFGFEKGDSKAPTIKSITLVPIQPTELTGTISTINGAPTPQTYRIEKIAGGWGVKDIISASGAIGVSVKTSDVVDEPRYSHSTYACRLYLNDVLITDVRHDSFDYSDTRLINIEREYDAKPGYAERPLRLFRVPGNSLWHYRTLTNEGRITLDETAMLGINEVRIEAEDVAGNITTATFQLSMGDDLVSESAVDEDLNLNGSSSFKIASTDWVDGGLMLYFDSSPRPPGLYLSEKGSDNLPVVSALNGDWMAWVPAGMELDTVWVATESERTPLPLGWQSVAFLDGGTLVSEDGRAAVSFTPGDLYWSSYFQFTSKPAPPRAHRVVSRVYEISPSNLPFARAGRLSINIDGVSNPSKAAIYRYRPDKGTWSFVGADRKAGESTIAGDVDYPGAFAVVVDEQPPTIRHVKPGKDASIKDRRPTIRFEMFDDLAGIGSDADVTMTIDGEWLPVEYDVDTRQAKARPRNRLSHGKHRVEIAVKDKVGNEETFLRILNIVK